MTQTNGHKDETELTTNDAIAEGLRLGLAHSLGQTGFNDINSDENPRRNLYSVFGWPRDDLDGWDEENWLALYLRNGYAKVVNDKPAETTWRDDPIVEDTPDQDDDSEFEAAIKRLERNFSPWSYGSRVDRIAGIGQHGLLIIGFGDVTNGDEPDLDQWEDPVDESQLSGLDDITTFKPILETQIDDIHWGGPTDGDRWDKPLRYSIDLSDDVDEETENAPINSFDVHYSRVIDVPATRLLDDETLARPRCEPVLNNLLDLEKTMGAVAEAAFMSANSDLHLNADPEKVDLSQGSGEIRDELLQFFEGQPFLRTQGMDVEQLGGDVQDPSGIVETNIDEISAVTGIPKKELRGNESGTVSGAEQDSKSYFGMIQERRRQYATPHIVRPLIQRLVDVGVLPQPEGGLFEIAWPDLTQLSELEESKIQVNRAQVLRQAGPIVDIGADYLRDGEIPEEETQPQPGQPLDAPTEDGDQQPTQGFAGVVPESKRLNQDFLNNPPDVPVGEDASERVRNLWKELINRAGLGVGGVTANDFNPALHPRDDEGQFVERPYDVPDELTNLDTEELLSELSERDPDFAEKVEDLNIGGFAVDQAKEGDIETPDFENVDNIGSFLEEKYPDDVTIDVREIEGPFGADIRLDLIQIPENRRGEGIGSSIMDDLTEYADEKGLVAGLDPSPEFGATSRQRLIDFYQRFGFQMNEGENQVPSVGTSMVREPETETANSHNTNINTPQEQFEREFGLENNAENP